MEQTAQVNKAYNQAETKIFNFRPIAFCACLLCLGIAFACFYLVYDISLWWLTIGIPFFGVPFFFCRNVRQVYRTALVLVALACAFCLGFTAFSWQARTYLDVHTYENTPAIVAGRVEQTLKTQYDFRVVLTDVIIDENIEKGKLVAYLPTTYGEIVVAGDEVLLTGNVTTTAALTGEYGINATAIGDGICFKLYAKECTVTGHTFSLFAQVRTRMQQVVQTGMDKTPAAVTLAVLLGDTSGIEDSLLENIRRGGIAHVFAVSGLHVGALFSFVLLVTQKTLLRRAPGVVRWCLVALVLFFYAGVCAFTASVVRAMVMCLCGYASVLLGTKRDFLETLGLAAIIVLCLSPVALFEAGFMLSFGACLGIVLLARPFEKCFHACIDGAVVLISGKEKTEAQRKEEANHPLNVAQRVRKTVVSYLAMSCGAQMATTPISMMLFDYVSIWTLLCNALFVPLIVTAFSVLLLLVAVACVLPISLSSGILYVINVFWSAVLLVFQTVDFSAFALQGITVRYPSLCCYYLAIAFMSDKLQLTKKARLLWACLCLVAFVAGLIV